MKFQHIMVLLLVISIFGSITALFFKNSDYEFNLGPERIVEKVVHDTVKVHEVIHDTIYSDYLGISYRIDSVIYSKKVPDELRKKKFSLGYVGLEQKGDLTYTKVFFGTVFDNVERFTIGCSGKVVKVRDGWTDCTGEWIVKIKEPLPVMSKVEEKPVEEPKKVVHRKDTTWTTKGPTITWKTKGPPIVKHSYGVKNDCGCPKKETPEFDGVI